MAHEVPKLIKNKSLNLFNWIAVSLLVVILLSMAILYFSLDLKQTALVFSLGIPVVLLSLYFNKLGKIEVSVMLFSYFFSFFFVFLSIYAFKYQALHSIIFLLAARFGLIITVLIAPLIYGVYLKKHSIIGMLPGILLFIFFDTIHSWFGIDLSTANYDTKQYIFVVIGLSFVFIIFLLMIYFQQQISYTYDKLVQKEKKITEEQHRLAKERLKQIEYQQKQIRDSILYAQRIQKAILPGTYLFEELTSDYFIFYRPKDIVSGDFFWINKIENKYIIIAADCTGHGVPGAFMSMLGISLLDRIYQNINEGKNRKRNNRLFDFVLKEAQQYTRRINPQHLNAAEILNHLREMVKISLKQHSYSNNKTKDGMDMTVLIYDKDTHQADFAGAHNPLFYVRNGELKEIKGDRMPVGVFLKEKPFTNHSIQFQQDDKIYMFSDGFADQFGGEKGGKYKLAAFKNLILRISILPFSEQSRVLENEFSTWKGNREQNDDILVIGWKIED